MHIVANVKETATNSLVQVYIYCIYNVEILGNAKHKSILTFVMRFVVSLHSDHSEIRFSDKVSIVHTGLKPI